MCVFCEPGKYQDEAGQLSCKWCSAGKYTPRMWDPLERTYDIYNDTDLIGSAITSDEARNSAWEANRNGRSAFFPIGRLRSDNGAVSVRDNWRPRDPETGEGMTDCYPCEAGTYNQLAVAPSQNSFFEFVNQTGGNQTWSAYREQYQDGMPNFHQHLCSACPAGFWTSGQDGQSECVTCPAGYDGGYNFTDDADYGRYQSAYDTERPREFSYRNRSMNRAQHLPTNAKMDDSHFPAGETQPAGHYNILYRTCRPCDKNHFEVNEGDFTPCFYDKRVLDGTCISGRTTIANNEADNIKVNLCRPCAQKYWTKGTIGNQYCSACVRGETYPHRTVPNDCIKCDGVSTGFNDRGKYNFVAGETPLPPLYTETGQDLCHACPSGMWCAGGDVMEVEHGWWVGSGLTRHRNAVKSKWSEWGQDVLNQDKCAWWKPDTAANPANPHPMQCDRDCTDKKGFPGCECWKVAGTGEEKCQIKCVQDDLTEGQYHDHCGIPRRVTRCSGFLRRVTCESKYDGNLELMPVDYWTEQLQKGSDNEDTVEAYITRENLNADKRDPKLWNQLLDKTGLTRTVRRDGNNNIVEWHGQIAGKFEIKHKSYCAKSLDPDVDLTKVLAARDNIVINGERFKVELNLFKISAEMIQCISEIGNDNKRWIMLNAQYLGPTTDQATVYKEPVLGHACEACRFQEIVSSVDAQTNASTDVIRFTLRQPQTRPSGVPGVAWTVTRSVILLKDDERVRHIRELQNATDKEPFANVVQCDFMNGYSGRLCQDCMPGWARRGQYGCMKCPPKDMQYLMIVLGAVGGILAIVIIVVVVISDAGSTSTASTLKRIILNHCQLVAICMDFNLNWSPAAQELFSVMGMLSSIGEQLIQADCTLNDNQSEGSVRPFYVKQIIYTTLAFGCISLSAVFWLLRGKLHCSHKSKRSRRAAERRVSTAMGMLDVRRTQIKNRWKKAKNNILQLGNKKRLHFTILSDVRSQRLADQAKKLRQELLDHGVEDPAGQDDLLADREAIARIRARQFVQFCKDNNINLKELFKKYAPDSAHAGEMALTTFVTLLKSLGMNWPEEDFECVADLFDASFHDGRVHLSTITGFEKTAWDNFIVTVTVIGYILYPTIAGMVFKLFACRGGLYDGDHDYYLQYDLESPCWNASHIAFVVMLGLPTIIVYIIGFPVAGLFFMYRRIKRYGWHDDRLMYRYAILMSGYRHECWYWEGVISFRKTMLIGIGIFGAHHSTELQFFMGVLVIVGALVAQSYARPFSNSNLNTLENWGLIVLFLSLYLGLLFFWEIMGPSELDNVAYLIIVMNAFFAAWCIGTIAIQWAHRHASSRTGKTLNWFIHESDIVINKIIKIITCGAFGRSNSKHENPFVIVIVLVPAVFVILFNILFSCKKRLKNKNKNIKKLRNKKMKKKRRISTQMTDSSDLLGSLSGASKAYSLEMVGSNSDSKTSSLVAHSEVPEDLFTWAPSAAAGSSAAADECERRREFLSSERSKKQAQISQADSRVSQLRNEVANHATEVAQQEIAYNAGLAQISADIVKIDEPSIQFRAKVLGTSVHKLMSELPYNGDIAAAVRAGDTDAVAAIAHHHTNTSAVDTEKVIVAWRELKVDEKKQYKAEEARQGRRELAVEHDREVAERQQRENALADQVKMLKAHTKALHAIDAAIKQIDLMETKATSATAAAVTAYDDDLDDIDMLLSSANVETPAVAVAAPAVAAPAANVGETKSTGDDSIEALLATNTGDDQSIEALLQEETRSAQPTEASMTARDQRLTFLKTGGTSKETVL